MEECVCCQEVPRVIEKMTPDLACITLHPGFRELCTDSLVNLQVAYLHYRQEHGHIQDEDAAR